ncbi:MAG: BlaI/MecI/CopY family transcriptional regulator [Lachnospiraceae bacterium]|nr:BlaI/MecI/CopY family transcriptional regulator [Lachnospiraceae bacterium]
MEEIKLGLVEARFADIIWQNEPLTTRELIVLCEKELEWKRTTTYTVLKKLSEKGIFQTENSVVTSILSKDEFYAIQSEQFVENSFKGSLPAFIAAFASRKRLSKEELDAIKQMIDSYEEE